MRYYRVIVADPPWAHGDSLGPRGAAAQYPLMTTNQICNYELPDIDRDALLFLWRLSSMVEDALRVAEYWGFRPVSEVVWVKRTKLDKLWFGMGRTVRNAHETAMICARGRTSHLVKSRAVRSVFEAPVPTIGGDYIHSAKPDEFFTDVIHPLIGGPVDGGPCVELFARRRRNDWDQFGNELPPLAATDAPTNDEDVWGYT